MEVLGSTSKVLMGALAEKLRAFLGREYELQAGVLDDIGFLQSELQFTHAFLHDYASCQASSTAVVKKWASEVQELAYDVEDAIDEYLTHRVGPAPAGIPAMVRHFVSTLMARRQVAQQARGLRARAAALAKLRKRYELPVAQPPSPSSAADDLRLPPMVYAETTTLVGIDGPRSEIVAKLTSARTRHNNASGRRRVAAMVGFAGVGKTTLAMAVYRSLEARFQCRACVTVSRTFDIRRVLKDILQQVMISLGSSSMPDPAIAADKLVDELRDILKDKRYLIIIDDLWEISDWKDISRVLPENTFDSIIITTTRNESVANACCSRYLSGHFVHKVEPLKDLDSRVLFRSRIFGSEDNCPHDLEEVSSKILKKCAGLPLAIVCISSLLAATRQEATKWEKVYESLWSEIECNDYLRRLKQALKVGFNNLPQHLKVCLLYLSAFPADCKIERDRLTRRWIAEGFVAEKPGKSAQEVAENYFADLVERSMIEAVDVDCFGIIHACRIHDVMFELIAMMSLEANFVTVIGGHRSTSTQRHSVHRLSLDCEITANGLDWSNFNISRARSLTIYGNVDNLDSIPLCRFLRMLDLECSKGVNSRHLKNIGDLFLLKYLSLKSTWIRELPPQIGKLKCLETLDLTHTNVRELPVEITQLQRLVHLLAGGAELPQGVGNMTSLQILCIRAANKRSKHAVKELLRLTNLRKLDMSYVHMKKGKPLYENPDNYLPSIISNLGKCKLQSLHLNLLGYSIGSFLKIQLLESPPYHLQSLRIKGEHGFQNNVPRWIGSLIHLSELQLTVRVMDGEDLHLEILARLPRLVRVRLNLKDTSRNGITIPESGFYSLKELFIGCRIMPVSFSQGVMPKLEKFELQFLAYQEDLKFLPIRTEHLQSLKGFEFKVAVCRGLSDREIERLKNAFKSAVFI